MTFLIRCFRMQVAGLLAASSLASSLVAQHPIDRVSVDSTGIQADGASYYGTISADGRFVAFTSDAANLVPGDTNGVSDVFRHDRQTGATIRVSVSSTGAEGDDESYTSYLTAISADGRYVAFSSDAANLVPNDANGHEDVFVRDVQAGTTVRVSVGPAGVEANEASFDASISADGGRIVFSSGATNLVSPSPANPLQVYVHDLAASATTIASVDSAGNPANSTSQYAAISGDGQVVAFLSNATNLDPSTDPQFIPYLFYLHDLRTGATRLGVSTSNLLVGSAFAGYASLSHDGTQVAFWSDDPGLVPGDTNGAGDAFVLDTSTGALRRASVSSTGAQGDATIDFPKISPDGRLVAFESASPDLVPGDAPGSLDGFVHDLATGATVRLSVDPAGRPGRPAAPFASFAGNFSADGRFVGLRSSYANLVPGDTNRAADVFVVDRASPEPANYCEAKTDASGCLPTMDASGTPSPTSTQPFDVSAEPVPAGRLGALLYALSPSRVPFAGGVSCIAAPVRRAAALVSAGSPGSGCTGTFSLEFNAWIRSGADPALVPGTVVYARYVYRDRGDAAGANLGLSDGLRFVIQP